ncbi:Mannosyltransferase [Venustampulla echinocandica]|uniref:Mannosyltransferase n=1 Tax=Venustampulla echinocandica TaxID=2656787 RepID=A0A370U0W7_9HELO|nr:Mannosyltransferase [Venustampulla echinocandica]RDL41408.1 Mannosyltransferase [Venustampulla echinocandica]
MSPFSQKKNKDTANHQSKPLPAPEGEAPIHSLVYDQRCKDIWILLLILRCINALCVRTFFQPDEYFQALEPAWELAFGSQSGAWITWEWEHQLRSSLHPAMFAAAYYVANKAMELVSCFPQFRAMILAVLPNLIQAYFAAIGDYYTWQLSENVYGRGSKAGWATLLMTIISPWQWFCSTRTFLNSLETSFTIAALGFWPWEMSVDTVPLSSSDLPGSRKPQVPAPVPAKTSIFKSRWSITSLRISLLLAASACILRPTNAMIWFCIMMPTVTRIFSPTTRATPSDYFIFFREAVLCGTVTLLIFAISDRLYFGEWTFPAYQFIHFNVNQDLAVFYGRNDWHYYISQGLPLLLTTYLPFGLIGLWKSASLPSTSVPFLLNITILVTIGALSFISHKEVRFIYPLLPLLHILAAPTIAAFFTTTSTKTNPSTPSATSSKTQQTTTFRRKPLLTLLLLANIFISGYTTFYHQRGVLSVLTFLRSEYETLYLDPQGNPLQTSSTTDHDAFAAFLMPCHSTPWRSRLFYPNLKAWALTCSPPLHLAAHTAEREAYRDEADRFFDNPMKFLKEEVNTRERPWPRYVVGFEGIEASLKEFCHEVMKGWAVKEKWRTGNTDWIDDSRRKGDVVVWEFVDANNS